MEIKHFKADYTGAFSGVDPKHPYYHLNVGLYELPLEDAIGACGYAYIPPETSMSCWSVTIVLPENTSILNFLVRSGWKDLADSEKVVLFLVELHGLGTSEGVAAIEAVRARLEVRNHYVTQVFFAYLVGYDTGATAALRYTMLHPSAYAGVAFVGGFDFSDSEEELACSTDGPLPYLSSGSVPVPAYFQVMDESESFRRAFSHFVERNSAGPEIYRDGGRWYSPASRIGCSDTINGQSVADVCADVGLFGHMGPDASQMLWKQVHRTIRTTGVGPGGLHAYRPPEDIGVARHELVVDGWTRHWYEYIPRRNVSRKKDLPVVFFLHGGTQVAESGMYAAEWFNVAESRDFIAVFPSGGVAQTRLNANPMPTWNIAGKVEFHMDDDKFLRAVLSDLEAREKVDKTRVYVTGHSMGSAMTQRCLMIMPDIFAAGVSNSGVVLGDTDFAEARVDLDVATWIEIGEYDVDDFDIANSERVRRNIEYWIDRGDLQHLDDAGSFSCGRYRTCVWSNSKGVPLLQYTAAYEKQHAVMPQDAWSYYDDFMCKFNRSEDGRLLYLGNPVR